MSTGLGGGLINRTPTEKTGAQATVTVTDARNNCFHNYASMINGHRSLRERHLRHGRRLYDQNGCRLYDQIVNHAADDSHEL